MCLQASPTTIYSKNAVCLMYLTRISFLCAVIGVATIVSACSTTPPPGCPYTKADVDNIRQLANSGSDESLQELAEIYRMGRCVRQDNRYAFKLSQQAAVLGNIDSQREVAKGYYSGQGVKQDLLKAEYWFRVAAEQGDSYSQHQLGMIYDKGIGVD